MVIGGREYLLAWKPQNRFGVIWLKPREQYTSIWPGHSRWVRNHRFFYDCFFYSSFSIDLDIENGSSSYYSDFVNKIRSLSKGLKKRYGENATFPFLFTHATCSYYITAAPQCPFPDAKVGDALNKADFDAVYVQFCNGLFFERASCDSNFLIRQ